MLGLGMFPTVVLASIPHEHSSTPHLKRVEPVIQCSVRVFHCNQVHIGQLVLCFPTAVRSLIALMGSLFKHISNVSSLEVF